MNLDFGAEPTFSWYVVMLATSGVIMIVLGLVGARQPIWQRAFGVLFGLGFAGYAGYLAFLFEGREYQIFFYAFILPVLALVNFVKALTARTATG